FGILRGCLYGRALEWFDRKILGKRWELHNIFANHGQAGMGALRGRTMAQMNTSNSFRNPSIAHDYANIVGNNAVTVGNSMIPAKGLSPNLKDDAERIGTEQPLADLFEILERIEMRRAEKKLGLVSKIPQS
ncbi:45936_t:CDS:2, partial [Gigaspora margarita]